MKLRKEQIPINKELIKTADLKIIEEDSEEIPVDLEEMITKKDWEKLKEDLETYKRDSNFFENVAFGFASDLEDCFPNRRGELAPAIQAFDYLAIGRINQFKSFLEGGYQSHLQSWEQISQKIYYTWEAINLFPNYRSQLPSLDSVCENSLEQLKQTVTWHRTRELGLQYNGFEIAVRLLRLWPRERRLFDLYDAEKWPWDEIYNLQDNYLSQNLRGSFIENAAQIAILFPEKKPRHLVSRETVKKWIQEISNVGIKSQNTMLYLHECLVFAADKAEIGDQGEIILTFPPKPLAQTKPLPIRLV